MGRVAGVIRALPKALSEVLAIAKAIEKTRPTFNLFIMLLRREIAVKIIF